MDFTSRTIVMIIGTSLSLFVLIVIWNRRLAGEIRDRKAAETALKNQLTLLEATLDTMKTERLEATPRAEKTPRGRETARSAPCISGIPVPETDAARIRGAHILVVEDDETDQRVAREILKAAGLRVSVADNGQTALEKLEHDLFHVVLMDIQMPVMDGFSATEAIRRSPIFRTLPVIAMAAPTMTIDREEGLSAGMTDYVTKPLDPKDLVQTLARWIDFTPASPPGTQRSTRTRHSNRREKPLHPARQT